MTLIPPPAGNTSTFAISLKPNTPSVIPSPSSRLTGCSRPHECQKRNGRKSFGRDSNFLTTMSHLASSPPSGGIVRDNPARHLFTIPGLTSRFKTQQISSPTLTGNWSPSVTQLRSIYALYSSSSSFSCGSRNGCWTHVFSCGHQYSLLP